MPAPQDLTGQKFGKLTVIRRHPENTKHNNRRWTCLCDCGKETVVAAGNLKKGHTTSCGCSRRPHGMFGTRLYDTWKNMKDRCFNKKCIGFRDYGGRGITVCSEWLYFIPFMEWALVNGYADDLQIDRKEVNRNYEPSNCRFVTGTVNNQNKRTTRLDCEKVLAIRRHLAAGKLLQREIGDLFGVPQNTISQIKHGHLWSSINESQEAPRTIPAGN